MEKRLAEALVKQLEQNGEEANVKEYSRYGTCGKSTWAIVGPKRVDLPWAKIAAAAVSLTIEQFLKERKEDDDFYDDLPSHIEKIGYNNIDQRSIYY